MSQLRDLAKHLGANNSISPAEAREVFGIQRLAARVYDLEQKTGVRVHREDREDAKGHRYTRYFIKNKQDRAALRELSAVQLEFQW